MSATISLNSKLIFCIENKDFKEYLKAINDKTDEQIKFLDIENVPRSVAENPDATLVLQSDVNENIFFDIGKKLKGVFFKELKVIFLSFDYIIKADALKGFSSFIQAPCSLDVIIEEANRLNDHRKRILLIDDSKLVHKNLVGPLKEKGFIVEQAFNGQEGVETALSTKPDLVICDIEMPVMNGFEACAEIRNNTATQDCYIIMSSTLKSAEDQKKGFAAGVDEYMPKPVIFDDLLERINRSFALQSVLREKILIIDEDEYQAENISNYLNKQGFSTRTCTGISDAQRLLKKFSSDLIISSTSLKDGSIIDVDRICKSEHTNSDLAFIGLVDQDNEGDRRMALNAGAKDTVATPPTAEALAAVVERTVAEIRTERERDQFQRYVSKASFQSALEKSVLSELSLPSRAEKRQAIVFFLDIAQFTGRCERYAPEEIVSQINNMFESITEIITKNDGDIDKFMGDACMSFWFDEGENQNHDKCLLSILEIQKAIKELNESDPIMKEDPLKVRMGLNSGDVILCDIGAAKARVDLTMIGDAVNIAARLETACSQYFIDNLVSDSVAKDAHDNFSLRIIDRIKVYGKETPVAVYEIINELENTSQEEKDLIAHFEKGFDAYTKGKFSVGLKHFQKAKPLEIDRGYPSTPSDVYISRCKILDKTPPEDWDGTWTLESK
ncbi:MAG: response regulator [Rhodobacterales bacterium]|nr:response regulator [Rhodobacterales bacterium]